MAHTSIRLEDAGLVLGTSSVLADYVEGMADWDIACSDQAQALTAKVIPGTAPVLVIHYRTPIAATWQFGSRGFSQPDYRHFATMHQTGVVVARPRGPLGTLTVRLRPETAACLLGEHMQYFLDARIGLDDLFGTSRVSLLVEMLAEARTSVERFACMESFLAANLRERRDKPVVCRAAALLRQSPHLRVRHLAARLDLSERHLQRSFQAMFGMRPKQFARIARSESVWSARVQGASWADIAYATRFTDQAHMVNDFTKIVGVPPAQLEEWRKREKLRADLCIPNDNELQHIGIARGEVGYVVSNVGIDPRSPYCRFSPLVALVTKRDSAPDHLRPNWPNLPLP